MLADYFIKRFLSSIPIKPNIVKRILKKFGDLNMKLIITISIIEQKVNYVLKF